LLLVFCAQPPGVTVFDLSHSQITRRHVVDLLPLLGLDRDLLHEIGEDVLAVQ
jgi:hypothetical protein